MLQIKKMRGLTDQEIKDALIEGDNAVTEYFFYKKSMPLFIAIIKRVFNHHVDYDEIINEFYCYLMEDDARRLQQFRGESTLTQWIKVAATRYFIQKRDNVIENDSKEPPYIREEVCEDALTRRNTAVADLERLFAMMKNDRYVYVIRRLILDDADNEEVAAELGIRVSNLYNIKKRAMSALASVAANDKREYGKARF